MADVSGQVTAKSRVSWVSCKASCSGGHPGEESTLFRATARGPPRAPGSDSSHVTASPVEHR